MKPPLNGSTIGDRDWSSSPEVPHHEVLKWIGGGSYGEVWLARNIMGVHRAIKVVRRSNFENEKPYDREFEGLRNFEPVSRTHDGFMDILQVGKNEAEGYFFYVMEAADDVVSGQKIEAGTYQPRTLMSEFKAAGRLPLQACLRIAVSLADSLKHLHGHGLVHRDIKPSNIIFVNDNPKLADIGLVTTSTSALTYLGAPGYIPPEGPGTAQGDVFALGKVLYEIVTGNDRLDYPKPPGELADADLPDFQELNEIILKACESDPRRRYSSAEEMFKDLVLLQGGKSVRRLRRLERNMAVARKYGVLVALAVVALLAVIFYTRRAAEQIRRAADQARWREQLGAAQILRLGVRSAGWSRKHAAHLDTASKLRLDPELVDNVVAGFAGLDMRMVAGFTNLGGSSVAFDKRGRALFGGLADVPAHLWNPENGQLEALKATGDGPVGFDPQERHLQFVSEGAGRFALLDLRTRQILREFELDGDPNTEHKNHPVLAMASDCSKVAAAVRLPEGGRFVVWDANTGDRLGIREERATTMVFSPDAACLATGDAQGRVTTWSLAGLVEIQRLPGGRAGIHGLAYGSDPVVANPAGSNHYPPWLLAAGDTDATIWIWDLTKGQLRYKCLGSHYGVNALTFSDDGTTLVSAGREEMQIWDVATGHPLLRNAAGGRFDQARALAFLPGGGRVAAVTEDGPNRFDLSVWDIEDNRGTQMLRGLASPVDRVWWSPNGRWLVALANDWELGVWEMPSGRLTHVFQAPIGESADNAGLAFSSDCQKVAFATGTAARIYDLGLRTISQKWQVPMGYSDSMRFEREDHLLFLHSEIDEERGRNRTWALWDLLPEGRSKLICEQADRNWVAYETFLPAKGDYFLVTGGLRDTNYSEIRALRLDTGQELWHKSVFYNYKNCSWAIDPTERLLAYRRDREVENVRLHTLPGGQFVTRMNHVPDAISPSGKQFVETRDSGWFLYENGSYDRGVTLASDFRSTLKPKYSPDGSRLAMPTAEGLVLVADVAKIQRHLRTLGWTPR